VALITHKLVAAESRITQQQVRHAGRITLLNTALQLLL
jgi:hypothetical protein